MLESMLKGLLRRAAGVNPAEQLMAPYGLVSGGDGKPTWVHPSPTTAAILDDFLGDAINPNWVTGSSDTGQSASVPLGVAHGVYRMTSSATSTQTPVGGAQQLSSGAQFKPNAGRLRMAWRGKIADLGKNNVFVGWTDTGGCEIGAYDTGGGIITPAADYAAFLKGGGAAATGASLTWRAVAGKAGSDQAVTTGITPVANVYTALEVEIDSNGHATYYINGVPVAQIQNAVTPTVALAGGIWRANTEAAADAIDTDWLNVSGSRDTGE